MDQDKNFIYYFAYGSNISNQTIHKYCPSAEKIAVAKLENYRLDFQFWATIIPCLGFHVWGIVWKIHYKDIPTLDAYEDVSNNLYKIIQVQIELKDKSNPMICRCYEMNNIQSSFKNNVNQKELSTNDNINNNLTDDNKPAEWYMKNIVEAAIENGFPEYYIKQLKSVPTI